MSNSSDLVKSSDSELVMEDSGYSAASLLLTTSQDLTTVFPQQQPIVQMPGTCNDTSARTAVLHSSMQDSGICQGMDQLSIESVTKGSIPIPPASELQFDPEDPQPSMAAGFNKDAWQEYYEQDEDGDVQLHLAIASGYVEVVHALIRMAPHPDYLSIQNNAMYAPLHIAVLQNQPNVARRLVIAGARLDIRDHEGNTPLHLAARRGNLECGEALLNPISVQETQSAASLYAQVNLPASSLADRVVDLRNHAGEHPVHLATMGGHVQFLKLLSWHNADMNIPAGRAGRSALHFAVGAKNMEAIQCLIEPQPNGCGVNVNQPDWYGRTAYQLALLNGAEEIANFLALRVAGIDVTPFVEDAATPSNLSEEEACETEDWSCSKNPSLLLNSNA